eukprot:2100553-Alexandrium_andersonii.AAC.1
MILRQPGDRLAGRSEIDDREVGLSQGGGGAAVAIKDMDRPGRVALIACTRPSAVNACSAKIWCAECPTGTVYSRPE